VTSSDELTQRQNVWTVLKNNSVCGVVKLVHFHARSFAGVDVTVRSLESEPVARGDRLDFSDREVTPGHDVES
jgi:hypothetical protein